MDRRNYITYQEEKEEEEDCTAVRRCQVFVDADNRTTTDEGRRREKDEGGVWGHT